MIGVHGHKRKTDQEIINSLIMKHEQSKQKQVTTYELSKQINQLRNIHNHNI